MRTEPVEERPALHPDVLKLGVVSFLTDVSSEMIFSVFAIYFTTIVGASRALLGLVEGFADFSASSLDAVADWLSDKTGKRKALAIVGYGSVNGERAGAPGRRCHCCRRRSWRRACRSRRQTEIHAASANTAHPAANVSPMCPYTVRPSWGRTTPWITPRSKGFVRPRERPKESMIAEGPEVETRTSMRRCSMARSETMSNCRSANFSPGIQVSLDGFTR